MLDTPSAPDARFGRASGAPRTGRAADPDAFEARLDAASGAGRGGAAEARKGGADLRGAAEQLVASAFVLPLLQQLRDGGFASERFEPGTGEELFQQRLDTVLADRIAASPGFPMVDALVRHMSRAAATRGPDAAAYSPPAPARAPEIDRHG